MGIYSITGRSERITTSTLPSGDIKVDGPRNGPLEQIMFDACRRIGYRSGYGWIVHAKHAGQLRSTLTNKCFVVA